MTSASTQWYNEGTTNSTSSYSYITTKWQGSSTTTYNTLVPYYTRYEPIALCSSITARSHESESERQKRLEKEKEENIKREKERENATKKARELLMEYLDEQNRAKLLQNEPVELESNLFKDVKYLIPISYAKIKAIKKDKVISELCISVKGGDLPLEDIVLTKLLNLKNDEESTIRTAKHYNVRENLITQLS